MSICIVVNNYTVGVSYVLTLLLLVLFMLKVVASLSFASMSQADFRLSLV